jgi:hypothetical protein
MATRSPRILCLGRDPVLLKSRCAVLTRCGYEAQPATVPEGYEQLKNGAFEVVIVSARLAKENLQLDLSLSVNTQLLVIDGFTRPEELLAAVREKIDLTGRQPK